MTAIIAVVVIVVALIAIAAVSLSFATSTSSTNTGTLSLTTTTTSTTPTTSTSSTAYTVDITIPAGAGNASHPNNFVPNTVSVIAGTTIVFVNKDTSTHDINFTSVPSGATISPNPSPNTLLWTNNIYSVTLTVPGTYVYVSDYQMWMTGVIQVN
jgi:plastocyanin